MEIDPHTIQTILSKVREQLRCPQCRKRMKVPMNALKVLGDGFTVLQLQCTTCEAHVALYASLNSAGMLQLSTPEHLTKGNNVSTSMLEGEVNLDVLRSTLKESGGSFLNLFEEQS